MYARRFLYASLMLLCCAAAASADIKIKARSSFGGQQGHETTTYIKGKRQRAEMPGGMATVTQCDLRRTVQLNGTSKTYMVMPFDDGAAGAPAAEAAAGSPAPDRRGGVVTTTMKVTDTGERKQMFGYTARRIKTSMVTESSPDACTPMKSRMESDGWYIDLNVGFDCYDQGATSYRAYNRGGGCQDTYRTKQIGTARTGYPVHVTTTMYDEAGNPSGSFTQEVTEISKAVLDAALFEVPADYREVKDASEMYSAAAASRADNSDADENVNAGADSPDMDDANSGSTPPANAQVETAAGPKQPGVVRVGVATPNALAADGIDTRQLAEAVRNTMVSYLSGPAVEVMPLQSRLPGQIDLEAKQKGCDFVVNMTVTHKKGGGGGFGSFLKRAAPAAASAVSYGGSTAGAAAYTAADFSASVKSRDELTLQYTVQRAGGSPAAGATLKAKARSDGEDLISYLVGQAAAAVLDAATRT
jgi:hypothetical protein